jgi:hypothetical protein
MSNPKIKRPTMAVLERRRKMAVIVLTVLGGIILVASVAMIMIALSNRRTFSN